MIEKAKAIVKDYVDAHLENHDAQYTMFVVWQCQTLQNFKCLIFSTLPVGMYFELTYDGDRKCWYFDAYRKAENRVVHDGVQYTNSQIKALILEHIHSQRDRKILYRRLVDRMTYEALAKEFQLTDRQIKNIVYNAKEILFPHLQG